MRFVHFYLIAYFALLIGASVALWKAGVLARIDGTLIAVVFVVAVGLGATCEGRGVADGATYGCATNGPARWSGGDGPGVDDGSGLAGASTDG